MEGVIDLVFFQTNIEFHQHSTGLSLRNLVDGLSGALHNTEALWGGQGVFRPASLHTLDTKKIENVSNRNSDLPSLLGIW